MSLQSKVTVGPGGKRASFAGASCVGAGSGPEAGDRTVSVSVWVCAQAEGEVLEIAVGTGRNLPHYRESVRLTGVELSPAMIEIARARARELGRDADLRVGDAQVLDLPDERFDNVVCTLSLCTIPDDRAAVAEVRRVLRPGGRFVLLEHVRSPLVPIRVAERLDPLMLRFEGDHLLREPLEHLHAEASRSSDWNAPSSGSSSA